LSTSNKLLRSLWANKTMATDKFAATSPTRQPADHRKKMHTGPPSDTLMSEAPHKIKARAETIRLKQEVRP
jgi:hypothetical protein